MGIREKARAVWDSCKKAGQNVVNWCRENPAEAVTLGLGVAGGITGAVNSFNRHRNLKIEERRRQLDIYDPVTGMHNILRRPLTAEEKVRVLRLSEQEDITITEALYRMGKLR